MHSVRHFRIIEHFRNLVFFFFFLPETGKLLESVDGV